MKLSLVRVCPLALVLAACGAEAPTAPAEHVGVAAAAVTALEPVTGFGANPAGLNMYRYVPQGAPPNAPLVLVLHGCMQQASDIANAGWNALADKLKFYVAYPEQTTANNPDRCFNWAGVYGNTANLKRGQGENESIKEMVDKMKADLSIDAKRVYAVGFSAGGAEVALLLATWPDVFAAGATFGGVPYDCGETVSDAYSCMTPGKDEPAATWAQKVTAAYPGYAGPWPRVSIWQGTNDTTVATTNTTQLMRQWTQVHGAPQTPTASDTVQTYPHAVYKDASGATVVETYAITGQGHAIFVDPASGCGTAASYVVDAKICSAQYAAQFFGIDQSAPAADGGTSGAGEGGASSGGTSSGGASGGSSGKPGGSGGASSGGAASNGAGASGGNAGDGGAADTSPSSGLAGCSASPARGSRASTPLAALALALALGAWARRARRKTTPRGDAA